MCVSNKICSKWWHASFLIWAGVLIVFISIQFVCCSVCSHRRRRCCCFPCVRYALPVYILIFYCVYNNMFALNVMCKQRQYNQKIIFLRWVHTMKRTNVEYLSALLSLSILWCCCQLLCVSHQIFLFPTQFSSIFLSLSSHTHMYLYVPFKCEHGKVNGNVFRSIAEGNFSPFSPSCHHAFRFCPKTLFHSREERKKSMAKMLENKNAEWKKNETSSSNFICESRGFCSCWLNSTVRL